MVMTANGEVQTLEEAQIHVHDLGLFVTVQLLDETPAVLSLGTLDETPAVLSLGTLRRPRIFL